MQLVRKGRKSSRRCAAGGLALALGVVLSACANAPVAPTAEIRAAHSGHAPPTAGSDAAVVNPTYDNGWRPLAAIAGGARQEHGVAALDGRIYVIGGIVPAAAGAFTTTDRVEVFDIRTDSWSDVAPLPVAMNHPNVATVGGRVYVIGGLSGGEAWRALPDSFVFDPAANRWTPLTPMPAGSERGSAALGVSGTRIYLAGGMRTLAPTPGGLHDTVDSVSSYEVLTGAWENLPNLPEARDHVGGAVVGTSFYVLGGRDRGQVNVRDTVYAFDIAARRWTERAPMPTPRGGIATAAVGSTIYTFGGEGNPAAGSDSLYAETEAYDTAADRWQQLAPMPVPRHGTAAVASGDTIHIPGGGNAGGGAPVDVNDAYRPR